MPKVILFALLVAVALGAGAATTPAQSVGTQELGGRADQLGADVRQLRRRVRATRAALRAQRTRLARVERRLEQDPPGLRSPDGRFGVDVSNEGVVLRAPSATVTLGAGVVTLASGAGTTVQVAPGRTALTAPVVSLGGGTGCAPVVRLGDPLAVQRAGETLQATITGSSLRVFAC